MKPAFHCFNVYERRDGSRWCSTRTPYRSLADLWVGDVKEGAFGSRPVYRVNVRFKSAA